MSIARIIKTNTTYENKPIYSLSVDYFDEIIHIRNSKVHRDIALILPHCLCKT